MSLAAETKDVWDIAGDQAMLIRQGIGERAWNALGQVEKQKIEPIFRGWVYIDKGYFPFIAYERVGKDFIVKASRLTWNTATHSFVRKIETIVASEKAIIWRYPQAKK